MDEKTIDPASMCYEVAGRVYRIGTRVMTPRGEGEIVAFAPGQWHDIGIQLDSGGEVVWAEWRYAEPLVKGNKESPQV